MIDDGDVDHVPHKVIPESQDEAFARFLSETQPAVLSSLQTPITDFAGPQPLPPDRLTFEPGDLCCFWRGATGWSFGMATVVSHVGHLQAVG